MVEWAVLIEKPLKVLPNEIEIEKLRIDFGNEDVPRGCYREEESETGREIQVF